MRIVFVVSRIEKFRKGNNTYYRINIPQEVVKKFGNILEAWSNSGTRLVVTVEEVAGESRV